MSPTSITRIVGELFDFGLLREGPATQGGVGRKATLLDIDTDAVFSVGIDVDVDAVQTCLIDLNNQPRAFLTEPFADAPPTPENAVNAAHAMYARMVSRLGISPDSIKAAGVSVGGTVARHSGDVLESPQLHWKNVPMARIVESRFGLPVRVENDVKAALLEEYVRHRDCRAATVAYLTIGSGIGAAVMANGRILRGANNAAGEMGHITVCDDGGLCDCGRRGCLYTYLSEKSVLRQIQERSGRSLGLADWVDARRSGVAWAVELAESASKYIAMALNHILCSYDPELILVGGRLIWADRGLLELALACPDTIYDPLQSRARIIHSLSGPEDAIVGAAILAKQHYLENLLHEKTT